MRPVQYGVDELAALGESTSKLEKRADEADRYVATFLKCSYLASVLVKHSTASSQRWWSLDVSYRSWMSRFDGFCISTISETTST